MRLTIVHLLQVKKREAEDDGEDQEDDYYPSVAG